MAITTLFLTGFEHGFVAAAASAGTGLFDLVTAGVSASTTSPRNGSYCCHLVDPGAAATRVQKIFATNPTKLVARVAVKVSTRPASGVATIIGTTNSGGSAVARIQITSAGVLQALYGATVQTGPTIDTTNWHLIELQIDPVAGTVDWRVDGVAQTRPTAGTNLTNINSMSLGTTATGEVTFTVDYDDWIVGSWTVAGTDWYGDGKVLGQLAGVDGTHATITSLSPGDAGTAYSGTVTTANTMVDDPPGTLGWTATRSTTDNLALRTATVGAYAEVKPAVTGQTGQANAVRAIMSYSSSATQANLAACDVRNSAGAVTELWGLTGGVGQSYALTANTFKGAIVTQPAAGWTAAEVNAIRFRFGGCTAADISPVPTVQAMMLEADWPIPHTYAVSPPLDQTSIDDFNRADGPIYAGAGASLWETSAGITSSALVAQVIGNQLARDPANTSYANSKFQLQASFDLLIDIIAAPGDLTVMFGASDLVSAGADGWYLVMQAPSWQLYYYNNGLQGSIVVSGAGVAPVSGSTIWIAKRGTVITAYYQAFAGALYEQILTIDDARGNIAGPICIRLASATTQRLDNLRGGPLAALGPVTSSIDDFNRADGLIDAGAGAAIWNRTQFDGTAGPSDLRTISNTLGKVAASPTWQSAYTKTMIDNSSGNCDVVIDCVAIPVTPNFEFSLHPLYTNPGATFNSYGVIWSNGTWLLRRYALGVNQGNITTAAGTLLAGDSLWFSKRGSVLSLYRKPSGGSYTLILTATDANFNPASAFVAIELSDSTQRWDNLSGGPLAVPQAFPRTASDAVAVSDAAAQRNLDFRRTADDINPLSDSAVGIRTAVTQPRTASDTVAVTDVATSLTGYSGVVLSTPGLVSYWRLGEASGNVLDSKDSNPGTVVGTGVTRNVAGLISSSGGDGALRGDGSAGTRINVPYSASMNVGAKLTVEMWLLIESYVTDRIFIGRDSVSTCWFMDETSNTAFRWYVRDANSTDTILTAPDNSIKVGQRQHIVGVYDAAGLIKLYINGVSVGTADRTPNANVFNATNQPLHMLAEGSLAGMQGTIDEVAFYNVALTAKQILEHYVAGSSGATALTSTASDTVATADSAARAPATRARPVTDLLTVSDIANRAAATRTRTAVDSLTVADAAARGPGSRARSAVDAWSTGDSALRAAGTRTRPVIDLLIITDSVLVTKRFVRPTADVFTVSDLAAAVSSKASLVQAIMADNPLGYWRQLHGAYHLQKVPDDSGNGHVLEVYDPQANPDQHLNVDDAPSLIVTEQTDPAMSFTPGNNLWDPAHYPEFNDATICSTVTISAWVKVRELDTTGWQDVVRNRNYGLVILPGRKIGGYANIGGFGIFTSDLNGLAGSITPQRTLSENTVYHLAYQYEAAISEMRVYIDGQLDSKWRHPGGDGKPIDQSAWNSFCIGTNQAAENGYDGVADEVALYNYLLTPARINAHVLAGYGQAAPVTRMAFDAWAVSDSATRAPLARPRTAVDVVVVSDNAVRAPVTRPRIAVDSITVIDTATRAGAVRVRVTVDSVTVTDAALRLSARVRPAGDSWAVSDVAARGPGVASIAYAQAIRADTPFAYWPMNDPSALQPEDQGGPDLVLNGATAGVPGASSKLGNAVSFDGVDDYGRASTVINLASTNAVTVEFWLSQDSYADDDGLALEFGETNAFGGFWINPNDSTDSVAQDWFSAAMPPGAGGDAGQFHMEAIPRSLVPISTWHHIVVLLDRAGSGSTEIQIYVDGVKRTTTQVFTGDRIGNFASLPLMVMGRSAVGNGAKSLFNPGDMQQLAIYSYVLSPTRIAAHYQAGLDAGGAGVMFTRTAFDTVTISDTAESSFTSGNVSLVRPVIDAWSVSDSVTRTGVRARSAVDVVVVSDVATRAPGVRVRPSADVVVVSDSAARPAAARVRVAVDAVVTTDSANRAASTLLRGAIDSWTASDTAQRAPLPLIRPAIDAITLADTAQRTAAVRARTALDSWIVADSAAGLKTGGIAAAAVDSVVIGDSAVRALLSRIRTALDNVVLTDVASKRAQFTRGASDAWTTTDSVLRTSTRPRAASDLVLVSDSALRGIISRSKTASDVWNVSDQAQYKLGVARLVQDNIIVTDVAGAAINVIAVRMTMIL